MTEKELSKAVAAALSPEEIENAAEIAAILETAGERRRMITDLRNDIEDCELWIANNLRSLNLHKRELYALGWRGPHKGDPE